MTQEIQSNSSDSNFPILAISIIGIIATSIILLSYYIFVTKCCINWHHRSVRRGDDDNNNRFAFYSTIIDIHGLDECAIQSLPNFRYQRGRIQYSFKECSVCLNEFQEEERIRMLPNCFHVFHIDCIDTWLQTHQNCPFCRSEITTRLPLLTSEITEQNLSQISPHENQNSVVEERGEEGRRTELRFEEKIVKNKNKIHVFSMGDESIVMRSERGDFGVQPIRRSFSLDSSKDRLLCIAVQEILQNNRNSQDFSNEEGSSNGNFGKIRKSFFSFSHSRSSKTAVLPILN